MIINQNSSKQNFLDILQKEYLVFSMRKGFYPSESDKRFFTTLLGFKKAKIFDLGSKLQQLTIFTSDEVLAYYVSIISLDFTFPNFFYIPQTEKEYGKKDLIYYYKVGAKFDFAHKGSLVIKDLHLVDIKNKICYFKENSEIFKKNFGEVERQFTFESSNLEFKF